jgi:hypothetical protein
LQFRLQAHDYGIVRQAAAINAAVRLLHAAHPAAQACATPKGPGYSSPAGRFGTGKQK